MKYFYALLMVLFLGKLSNAQVTISKDSLTKTGTRKIFTSVEQIPEFPGGVQAFYQYISKNLQYPDVARLIGINGKLSISFIVDKDGKITDATPKNCIGAGCEAEAVRLLEASPTWKPGIQNGTPVRVMYTVPINFTAEKGKVTLKDLRKSGYGFVFNIKDSLYTIDEAETIIGRSFMSDDVEIAEPFYNYNKIQKFEMPDKKEVYLLIFKSS